jgi:hypothetical protein
MFGHDQRGVAALVVVIIVAASTGAAIATPVVVSAVGADPDSPLYGLARLGEQIRMISNEDQMKNRWVEYTHMVSAGKGLEYTYILEEFAGKMNDIVSENAEQKQELMMWMQDQMPSIENAKLELIEELCRNLEENLPGASGELENVFSDLENLGQGLATPNTMENVRAELELKSKQLEQIVENQIAENQNIKDYENQLCEEIENYFATENILVNVDVKINVEVSINIVKPTLASNENELENEFENELENFSKSLSETQAMLAGAPENTPGINAAEQQIELAVKSENDAENAYAAGKIWNALILIRTAQAHLQDAETILNHASEWEPEFGENWTDWKETWNSMEQQWVENGIWENIVENYNQYENYIQHQWQDEQQEQRQWENVMQQWIENVNQQWENMKQQWENMGQQLENTERQWMENMNQQWENTKLQGENAKQQWIENANQQWENMKQQWVENMKQRRT